MKGRIVFKNWEFVVFSFVLLFRRGVDSSSVFIFKSFVIGCLLVEALVETGLINVRLIYLR